jgi:anti-sigma regulatory factor (Ser/Thr protein kinase)
LNGDGLRLQLDCDPRSPSSARQPVTKWLNAVGCSSERHHGLLLVVSELVTSAVVHARAAPEVVATHRRRRVRVEVYDDDVSARSCVLPAIVTAGAASVLQWWWH